MELLIAPLRYQFLVFASSHYFALIHLIFRCPPYLQFRSNLPRENKSKVVLFTFATTPSRTRSKPVITTLSPGNIIGGQRGSTFASERLRLFSAFQVSGLLQPHIDEFECAKFNLKGSSCRPGEYSWLFEASSCSTLVMLPQSRFQ